MDRSHQVAFQVFADEAAINERIRKLSVLRLGDKSIEYNWDFEPRLAESTIHLSSNVTLLVDHAKAQWLKQKNNEEIDVNDFEKKIIPSTVFDKRIDAIKKTAIRTHAFSHHISELIRKPVVLVLNARTATVYGLISGPDEIKRKKGIKKWYEKHSSEITKGNEQSAVYIIADTKISSKKYVQTQEEALRIQGHERINRLRPQYKDVDNEMISEDFVEALFSRMPLIFVDVPSWGSAYASSTGLIRKNSDIMQREDGIFSPYKMRSYLDYLKYQIFAISNSKVKGDINIDEECNVGFDFEQPIGIILNPEFETDIWWDNCPQLLGAFGNVYSEVKNEELQKIVYVETTRGKMDLYSYICERLRVL